MELKYNTEELQRIASDIYYSTGISVSFFESDFTYCSAQKTDTNGYCKAIRKYPGIPAMCAEFDKSLLETCRETGRIIAKKCHGGLLNIASPIKHGDRILGYVVFYSIKTEDFKGIPACIRDCPANEERLGELYHHIKKLNTREYEAVCNIATIVAKYVMLENLIQLNTNEKLESIKKYIADNLDKDLSVKSISKNTNISKSVLYKLFSTSSEYTVSEYINRQRIAAAKRMLLQTDMSIEEISKKCGYTSSDYFGRVFKKFVKLSPQQYRKEYSTSLQSKKKDGNSDEKFL